MITHSLLSAWLYSMQDNPFADATQEDTSKEDFLRALRREPTPTTEAMQNGIDFEDLITQICECRAPTEHPWLEAARKVALHVNHGQLQYVASKTIEIEGMSIFLYGRLDALKAGQIFDIKFSKTYERGKYFGSTQHPMYLELVPEARSFTYLISNGEWVWTETYRRDEAPSILPTVRDFLRWLKATGMMEIYTEHWQASGNRQ